MDTKKDIVFDNKTVSDLFKIVFDNVGSDASRIDKIINEIKVNLNTDSGNPGGDTLFVAPIIKDLLDVGVKNRELLIKLLTVIQRFSAPVAVIQESILTDDDKEQIRQSINQDTKKKAREIDVLSEELHKKLIDLEQDASVELNNA